VPRVDDRIRTSAEEMLAACRHDRASRGAALEAAESRIFVNDPRLPTVVLLWTQPAINFLTHPGISFLAGALDPQAVRACLASAIQGLNAEEQELRYISLLSAEWGELLQAQYGHAFFVVERVSLVWRGADCLPATPTAPPGAVVAPIDEELASRIPQELDPGFAQVYPTPAAFLAQGLGYCVLFEDQLASVAWICARHCGEAEIAVWTAEPLRRRGFCRLACAALMRDCHARGLTLDWIAFTYNHPSVATARALGFSEDATYLWAQHTPWNAHRRSVPVSGARLEAYCGEYELANGRSLYISAEGDELRIQFWNQSRPRHTVLAESDTCFFLAEDDIQLSFRSAGDGRTHVTFRMNGEEQDGTAST
jgi:hypothetical protein